MHPAAFEEEDAFRLRRVQALGDIGFDRRIAQTAKLQHEQLQLRDGRSIDGG